MKKTRILALLLSVLMLVGMFAGCGQKKVSYGKIGDYEIYPFPLQDFKSYKISLRPRTLFVEFEPHVSAAIIGAITLGICVLIEFIYSVIKQNKT